MKLPGAVSPAHALDYTVGRLADAAVSRALNGVARPVFYKGEQIGERRYYDERLTMFLLRHRRPVIYGAANNRCTFTQVEDGPALIFNRLLNQACDDAHRQLLDEEDSAAKWSDVRAVAAAIRANTAIDREALPVRRSRRRSDHDGA